MSKHKKKHPRGHGAPGSHGGERAGSTHGAPQAPEAASHPASDADADAAVDARAAAPAPAPEIAVASVAANVDSDIRGVLIQVAGARLLLPNATIAEVLSYAEPEPLSPAPDWLLGRIRWRGWQLPLVAFSRLAGLGDGPAGPGQQGGRAQGAGRQREDAVLCRGDAGLPAPGHRVTRQPDHAGRATATRCPPAYRPASASTRTTR